jgi:hypothetical protein
VEQCQLRECFSFINSLHPGNFFFSLAMPYSIGSSCMSLIFESDSNQTFQCVSWNFGACKLALKLAHTACGPIATGKVKRLIALRFRQPLVQTAVSDS